MKLTESVRIAFQALIANKMRAALTMLGIVIGVAAVITLVSAGQAVSAYVTGQFQGLGSNLLFVLPGQASGGPGGGETSTASLTNGDAAALLDAAAAPDVEAIAPELSGSATVTYAGESSRVSVSGVTPAYSSLRDAAIGTGRFITAEDVAAGSRVAVLGPDVVSKLFPDNGLPIGETIRINDVAFKVVGVMAVRGGSAFGNEDNALFIPLSTAQQRTFPARGSRGDYEVSTIYVQVLSSERMQAAGDQVRQVLRQRHQINLGDDDDFSVISQSEIVSSLNQVLSVVTLFLGAVAAISLLVGGIGIMNIMLVSVTERTREIGLRKAVGARRGDILMQFLVESVVLSVVGGLIGIALGGLGSQAISALSSDIQPSLSVGAIALATGFSAAVGLFFGIYPASRAAGLEPIVALRYE